MIAGGVEKTDIDPDEHIITGDTPGAAYRLRVVRMVGNEPRAPKVYLQAALHGAEVPGTAALHFLIPLLRDAQARGALLGDVTIVPYANPIGLGQDLFGQHQGRFSLSTRTNFNRDFALRPEPGVATLPGLDAPISAEQRLKAHLLRLSEGHDIVLDLHCDDEGVSYLYIQRTLWPAMADLAKALGSRAVMLWDETADGAFEEAAFAPHAGRDPADASFRRIAIATVELRGIADVSPDLARSDAAGLFRFLVGRGVVAGNGANDGDFEGVVAPLENVEMVRSPASGAILYHVIPGDNVAAGDLLATILTRPGEPDGGHEVRAPQKGFILTRRSRRVARLGEDLVKLVGERPSATAKPGSLEA